MTKSLGVWCFVVAGHSPAASSSVKMPVLQLPAVLLPVVSFALDHYPEGTPSRFQCIAKFLSSYCVKNPSHVNHHVKAKVSHSIFKFMGALK